MNIELILPIFLGILSLLGAAGTVFCRQPIHALLSLIATFITTAPLWLLFGGEFLSFTLIIVYVGAVMTLFLFVVMMINLESAEKNPIKTQVKGWPWILGGGLLLLLLLLIFQLTPMAYYPQTTTENNRVIAKVANGEQMQGVRRMPPEPEGRMLVGGPTNEAGLRSAGGPERKTFVPIGVHEGELHANERAQQERSPAFSVEQESITLKVSTGATQQLSSVVDFSNSSNAVALGKLLYTHYLATVEVAALLLLAGMVIAILLKQQAATEKPRQNLFIRRRQQIAKQVATCATDRLRLIHDDKMDSS